MATGLSPAPKGYSSSRSVTFAPALPGPLSRPEMTVAPWNTVIPGRAAIVMSAAARTGLMARLVVGLRYEGQRGGDNGYGGDGQ